MWENVYSVSISIHLQDVSADAEFRVEVSEQTPQLETTIFQSTTIYIDGDFYIVNEGIYFNDTDLYVGITDISTDVSFYLFFDDYYTEIEFEAHLGEDVAVDIIFRPWLAEYEDIGIVFVNPVIDYVDSAFRLYYAEYDDVDIYVGVSKLDYEDIYFLTYSPLWYDTEYESYTADYYDADILTYVPSIVLIDIATILSEYVDVDISIYTYDIAADIDFIVKITKDTPIVEKIVEEKGTFYFIPVFFRMVVPTDEWYDVEYESYIADYLDIDFKLQSDTDNILKDVESYTADYYDFNINPVLAEYVDHVTVHPTADYYDFDVYFVAEPPFEDWWFTSYTADYVNVDFFTWTVIYLDTLLESYIADYLDIDFKLQNDTSNVFVDTESYTADYYDINTLQIIADTVYLDVSLSIRISDFPSKEDIKEDIKNELGGLTGEDEEVPPLDEEDYDNAIDIAQGEMCELYQQIYGPEYVCEEWEDLDPTDCRVWNQLGDTRQYNKCICNEVKAASIELVENATTTEEIIDAWDNYYLNDQCTSACDKYYWKLMTRYIDSGGSVVKVGDEWILDGGDLTIWDDWYTSPCTDECSRIYYRCYKEYERTGDPNAFDEWNAVRDYCAPAGGGSGGGLDGGGAGGGGGGGAAGGGGGGGTGNDELDEEDTGDGWSPGIWYPGPFPFPMENIPGVNAPVGPSTPPGGIYNIPGIISPTQIAHPTFGTVEWVQHWARKRSIRHIYQVMVNIWIEQFSLSKAGKSLPLSNIVRNIMAAIDIYDNQWKMELKMIKKGIEDAIVPYSGSGVSASVAMKWIVSPYTGNILVYCDGNCASCGTKC